MNTALWLCVLLGCLWYVMALPSALPEQAPQESLDIDTAESASPHHGYYGYGKHGGWGYGGRGYGNHGGWAGYGGRGFGGGHGGYGGSWGGGYGYGSWGGRGYW